MAIPVGGRTSLARRMVNIAVVIAIAAVALASLLDRLTRDGGASAIAFLLPEDPARAGRAASQATARAPRFTDLDTTPTGAIGRPIVLDPCTGERK